MSWFDRRSLLVALVALTGCGYTPVYGPGGTAETLRGRIEIANPIDEEGFFFVDRLRERLGESAAPDLLLTADLFVQQEAIGLLPDGAISRFNVIGRVKWTLTKGEAVVASGEETAFTGYSTTSTTVATITAERAARRRLMIILADRITADLLSRPLP